MTVDTEPSEFITWTEAELRRAGLFDEDSDYGGMLGEEVLRLAQAFDAAGHSGFSAAMAASIFSRLADRKPLGPLTNDPDEWMHIDADMAGNPTTWQSRRQPSCFSNDGGRTFYDIDEEQAGWRRGAEWLARRLHLYRAWAFHRRHTAVESGHTAGTVGRTTEEGTLDGNTV